MHPNAHEILLWIEEMLSSFRALVIVLRSLQADPHTRLDDRMLAMQAPHCFRILAR
jgi:hypothetical protein